MAASDKTHSAIFVSEVLTSLFHDTPQLCLNFLARDGTKFLNFYWEESAKRIDPSQRRSSFGLNYDLRFPWKDAVVALIILPKPLIAGEAFYAALAYRPYRITPIFHISDATKVIALEHHPAMQGNETLLVEWDRKMRREKLGAGPLPVLGDFYKAVINLIKD